jgi:hypothetical protein
LIGAVGINESIAGIEVCNRLVDGLIWGDGAIPHCFSPLRLLPVADRKCETHMTLA